jgi:hypothetical protein
MGPAQHPPEQRAKQERSRWAAKRHKRRPRLRWCLLKGCGQRFRPKHPWSRYCGDDCRNKAKRWSRWKAQKRYRGTGLGKQKRREQSCRHRERVRTRKPCKSPSDESARVIKAKNFSTAPATGRVATSYSHAHAVLPCRGSARRNAGTHWNASWSGNGAGGNGAGRNWPCRAFPGPFARPD